MIYTGEVSNQLKYELIKLIKDAEYRAILMKDTFTYNKDTHSTYSDVSALEVGAGNGYLQQGVILAAPNVILDLTSDYSSLEFSEKFGWLASGGAIGPASGILVFNNTSSNKYVIGFASFGTNKIISDGQEVAINKLTMKLT